jgi:hypothetical protein
MSRQGQPLIVGDGPVGLLGAELFRGSPSLDDQFAAEHFRARPLESRQAALVKGPQGGAANARQSTGARGPDSAPGLAQRHPVDAAILPAVPPSGIHSEFVRASSTHLGP